MRLGGPAQPEFSQPTGQRRQFPQQRFEIFDLHIERALLESSRRRCWIRVFPCESRLDPTGRLIHRHSEPVRPLIAGHLRMPDQPHGQRLARRLVQLIPPSDPRKTSASTSAVSSRESIARPAHALHAAGDQHRARQVPLPSLSGPFDPTRAKAGKILHALDPNRQHQARIEFPTLT